MADVHDWEISLYPQKVSRDTPGGPVRITVRASSAEDAKRQAKAQFPKHTVTAAPRKMK
jgi:hypothetical protein